MRPTFLRTLLVALHAALQPRIDLARWPSVENQNHVDRETELNKARYAFATRAMFMLAARHGDDAPALLWRDVARTPRAKVSAKTFASVYRKRFRGDLGKLIAEAEKSPVPPE